MNNLGAEMQAVEMADRGDLYSFKSIFTRVVECTKKHGISEKKIFGLLPKNVLSYYPYACFKRGYDEALFGEFDDGIMNKAIAEGILRSISVFDNGSNPKYKLIERSVRQVSAKEGLCAQDETALSRLFASWAQKPLEEEAHDVNVADPQRDDVDVVVSEPVIEVISPAQELFEIDQVRDYISGVLSQFNHTPYDILGAMSDEYKTPANRAQVEGWFDGTVKQSPKALVAEFFEAIVRVLKMDVKSSNQKISSHLQAGMRLV